MISEELTAPLLSFAEVDLVKRDSLVSKLLQDRGALRLISAPSGFGKSALAYEYAHRLFSDETFLWVDAGKPDFLRVLDQGPLVLTAQGGTAPPQLVVIDALPYLDEERAQTLSGHVDTLLYQGIEVVVTTVPSHDCLRVLQPDRVLISAVDLLVSKKEYGSAVEPGALQAADISAADIKSWEQLREIPFGLTPAYVWSDRSCAQKESLTGFFEERLPLEMQRAVFCMLLLGRGGFDDLERLGVGLRTESESMLVRDYPFLGIDPLQRSFATNGLPVHVLHEVIADTGWAGVVAGGTPSLVERVLGLLLDGGNGNRATQVLEYFCSAEQCGAWLLDRGWDLIDRGELTLVDMLLERCTEQMACQTPELNVLRAWCCGLQGDFQEACYYAHRAGRCVQVDTDAQESDIAGMMAYLALLAFDRDGAIMATKGTYACDTLSVPGDLLATVVDGCREIELMRALELALSGHYVEESEQDERREACVVDFELLLTQCAERFQGSAAYRLALHLVCAVESPEVQVLMKSLGCGMIVAMRRHGVHRFTEAILVADLWRCGFFGVSGRAVDFRDAQLLNDAARILKRLGSLCGFEARGVPWESGTFEGTALPTSRAVRGMAQANAPLIQRERIAVANVRLLGCVEVMIGEDYVPESRWRRKALQLFAVLVMHQGRDVLRDFLLEQLWPQASHRRALDNYYTVWSNVVTALNGGPYLERRGEFCRVNHRYVSSDVGEFEQLTRRLLTERSDTSTLLDICARLESLYRGGLMPGGSVCPFIEAQRERYQRMFVDAMVMAVSKALDMKDAKVALWFASRAMESDAQREDVFKALMEAQVAAGQRCSAMHTYFKCRDFLRGSLGLDPSEQIQEMYTQLIVNDPALLQLESSVVHS